MSKRNLSIQGRRAVYESLICRLTNGKLPYGCVTGTVAIFNTSTKKSIAFRIEQKKQRWMNAPLQMLIVVN